MFEQRPNMTHQDDVYSVPNSGGEPTKIVANVITFEM